MSISLKRLSAAPSAIVLLIVFGCSQNLYKTVVTTENRDSVLADFLNAPGKADADKAAFRAALNRDHYIPYGKSVSQIVQDEEHFDSAQQVFDNNCASCHGKNGTGGGVGPVLGGGTSEDRIRRFVKNPEPPMPKLYPSVLSDEDVSDLARYISETFSLR